MTIDEIQDELMTTFSNRTRDLSIEDYRDLCENLASDFECRYEAAKEEADKAE